MEYNITGEYILQLPSVRFQVLVPHKNMSTISEVNFVIRARFQLSCTYALNFEKFITLSSVKMFIPVMECCIVISEILDESRIDENRNNQKEDYLTLFALSFVFTLKVRACLDIDRETKLTN